MKLQKLWQTRSSKRVNIPLIGLLWLFIGSQWGIAQCEPTNIAGVPSNATIEESYTIETEQSYVLPAGVVYADLSDMDKSRAEFRPLVERVYKGHVDDVPLTIKAVDNMESFYKPQHVPVSHTVHLGEMQVAFAGNSVLNVATLSSFADANSGIEGEGEGSDVGGGLTDGTLDTNGTSLQVDTISGMVFYSDSDENGDIQYQEFEWFDMESSSTTPVYRLSYERRSLPSGLCAWALKEQTISDRCISAEAAPRSSKKQPLQSVTIYPNPVRDILNFDIDALKGEKIMDVQVFDMSGYSVLIRQNLSNFSLNVGHMQPGLYIIKIVTDQNSTFISKFIKQ